MNEAIDFSDIPELGDEFFSRAKKRGPLVRKNSVIVDHDIYDWFRTNIPEPECSSLISEILRNYMEEQRAKSAASGAGQGVA